MRRGPKGDAGELKCIAAIVERPVIQNIPGHLGLDLQLPSRAFSRHAGCDSAT